MKGWRLITETPRIEVTSSAPKMDPNWAYVDRAGHPHTYASRGVSFAVVVDGTEWCHDCNEHHTMEHFECVDCTEKINPGMTGPTPYREYVAGPTEAYLEGPEGQHIDLTQEQINFIMGADQEVVSRVLLGIIEEVT